MYGREMIYLTLYQGNNRIGNAGYVKVDIRDEDATFHFMFRKIPDDIRGEYPLRIMEDGAWKEGPGLLFRGNQDTAEKKSAPCGQIQQLQVLLEKGYRIEGKSKNCPAQAEREAALPKVWTSQTKTPQQEREIVEEREPQPEREAPQPEREAPQSEREAPQPEKGIAARVVAAEEIREDKWEQILATYETIHPYGDGRVYVKLEPKDFVIMQGKYQHLVNNSFLLHGFYNYRYLILGKEQGKEYYLGVPGVFYEREKMVALMFGFEAFDCEGGNASPGGFGYYLRRVEL